MHKNPHCQSKIEQMDKTNSAHWTKKIIGTIQLLLCYVLPDFPSYNLIETNVQKFGSVVIYLVSSLLGGGKKWGQYCFVQLFARLCVTNEGVNWTQLAHFVLVRFGRIMLGFIPGVKLRRRPELLQLIPGSGWRGERGDINLGPIGWWKDCSFGNMQKTDRRHGDMSIE